MTTITADLSVPAADSTATAEITIGTHNVSIECHDPHTGAPTLNAQVSFGNADTPALRVTDGAGRLIGTVTLIRDKTAPPTYLSPGSAVPYTNANDALTELGWECGEEDGFGLWRDTLHYKGLERHEALSAAGILTIYPTRATFVEASA